MLVLGFPDSAAQSRALALALKCPAEIVELHRFPDAESRLRLPIQLPRHVVLCRSLDRPNEKLIELMLAARTARELGVERLTLVAPYLCYMRQDTAFRPGEVVSQRIIGAFLARLVEELVTVDPHLHRVRTLSQAVPAERAVALTAASAMGAFLAAHSLRPLLLGPDQESEQWVRSVAQAADLDYRVAAKIRRGDRSVEVELPARSYTGDHVVLVDDVASTGHTLAVAAQALRRQGASRVDVLVTHALFVGDALSMLKDAGVTEIWSSDSVEHPTNAFSLAPLLAEGILR